MRPAAPQAVPCRPGMSVLFPGVSHSIPPASRVIYPVPEGKRGRALVLVGSSRSDGPSAGTGRTWERLCLSG